MRIRAIDSAVRRPRRIAIGQFDGVHRGHRAIIAGCDTVLTFDPHPQTVVGTKTLPATLSPLTHKAKLLSSIGVSEMIVVQFDEQRAAQSAEDFVQEVLIDALGAELVCVGANFRYGSHAKGDVDSLSGDGRFDVRVGELVEIEGIPVSSTRIRGLVRRGDIATAAALLGSNVFLRGIVRSPATSGCAYHGEGALVSLSPGAAIPPRGNYQCMIAGEWASMTIAGPLSSPSSGIAGWVRGPVDIVRGSVIDINLQAGLRTVVCPESLRALERVA
jgi:riboflavin kinase / FMN adenylyltransferase